VWFAGLDCSDAEVNRSAHILTDDESQRAARFHHERDRRRFIIARAVLREILGFCLGVGPRRLSFRCGQFGKPMLAGEFEQSEIRFNMSHSGGGALYAVSLGREVGVDLELIRPLADMSSLAQSCFSAAENLTLQALLGRERLRGFFDGWTRKEAFLKATGHGLSFSLQAFEVSLAPGVGRRALTLHHNGENEPAWTLVSLAPLPDYAAALVVHGQDCSIACAEWLVEPAASPDHFLPHSLGR
jgi:4'-phosphopantetheinyl transferase